MQIDLHPLHLPEQDFLRLFQKLGPSLGLWRAAEIACLRGALAGERKDAPVLDLGCGDGLVTSFVLAGLSQPLEVTGLDLDRQALEHAGRLGIYSRLVPFPVEDAGLEEGSFAVVMSNSVLEHIRRIDDALAAAARALKPGGALIFTCPTEAFSGWLALPGTRYAAARNRHFQHLNLWPVEEWARRLSRVDLSVECVKPVMRRGWVRAWDVLELLQMIRFGGRRLFGRLWRRLPEGWLAFLARQAARIDLSAPPPGGGRMIIARK